MKKIDRGAFSTKTLKECYSYATTPPSIYTNFPQSFSSEADAILYVPAGCEIRYSKYNVLFKNIIEMD